MSVCSSYVQLFVTSWTIAHQPPLSMEFSKQEYFSGLPLPTPGDLPDPGIKPLSPASPALAGGFFITVSPGKPRWLCSQHRTSTVIPNIFIKLQRSRLHAGSHLPLQQSHSSWCACSWRQRKSKWEMIAHFQPHDATMLSDEDSKMGLVTINHQTDDPEGV